MKRSRDDVTMTKEEYEATKKTSVSERRLHLKLTTGKWCV